MRKLHPATIAVSIVPRFKEVVSLAIPALVGTYVSGSGNHQEWVAAALGSLTGIFAIGTYWTTRFDLAPDHVIHKTGWIFRNERRIPLEQIQNVNIRQNLLERLFGVATVDVETAMGKGRDLKLSVLKLSDAERFREELLLAAHLSKPVLEGAAPQKVAEPLIRLNRHDLLLGAITENHFAQMFATIFGLGGPSMSWVMKYIAHLGAVSGTAVAVVAVLVLPVGGWAWGAASYYLKYGGFVVFREEGILRISYGLVTRDQLAIRPRRIEYARVTATIPQRWMRRATLQVGTASSFGEAGVLAPIALFVERYVAYQGAAEIMPGLDIPKLRWQPFHPVFYWGRVLRSAIVLAILTAAAAWLAANGDGGAAYVWGVWGLLLVFRIFALGALFASRAENGFAVTEDAVVVRQGYLHQSISAMPIERIENVSITQPAWWQRRGAAHLTAQAMKQRIHVSALSESSIQELLARWHEKMEHRERLRTLESEHAEADAALAALQPPPAEEDPAGVA